MRWLKEVLVKALKGDIEPLVIISLTLLVFFFNLVVFVVVSSVISSQGVLDLLLFVMFSPVIAWSLASLWARSQRLENPLRIALQGLLVVVALRLMVG